MHVNSTALALSLVLLCAAGATVSGETRAADSVPYRPDFSGAWEKDFSRSDRWEDELNRQLAQMRRDAERGVRSDYGGGPAVVVGGSNRRGRGANIVELAQLAGYIHRQTTLRIYQTAYEIRVEREGDADLVCSTLQNAERTFASELGEEVCGWDDQQLVFRIGLPEGVDILHRFSVSEDREWLNLATVMTSNGGSPFTLLQFFRRYEAPSENFNCIQTISRGNSCRLTDAPLD
ncbi:MAG: hypothetical protein RLZZ385_1818 [Pseudomonadota bacterium]